ncbi:MAG: zinc ribbon domain-containing protein [Candidatus Hodarchaeales archaeon]|jgi:hypothetical protein
MSLNYTENKETSLLNYLFIFNFLELHHPRDKDVHIYSTLLLFVPFFSFVNIHSSDKTKQLGILFLFIIPIPIFWGFYLPKNNILSGIGFLIFLPVFPIIRGTWRKDDFQFISLFLLFIPLFSLFHKYNKEKDRLDVVFLFLFLPILISRSHHLLGILKLFKSQEIQEVAQNSQKLLSNCPNCGVQLEADEVFCSACGNKIPH